MADEIKPSGATAEEIKKFEELLRSKGIDPNPPKQQIIKNNKASNTESISKVIAVEVDKKIQQLIKKIKFDVDKTLNKEKQRFRNEIDNYLKDEKNRSRIKNEKFILDEQRRALKILETEKNSYKREFEKFMLEHQKQVVENSRSKKEKQSTPPVEKKVLAAVKKNKKETDKKTKKSFGERQFEKLFPKLNNTIDNTFSKEKKQTYSKNRNTPDKSFGERAFDKMFPELSRIIDVFSEDKKNKNVETTDIGKQAFTGYTKLTDQLVDTNKIVTQSIKEQVKTTKLLEELLEAVKKGSGNGINLPDNLPGPSDKRPNNSPNTKRTGNALSSLGKFGFLSSLLMTTMNHEESATAEDILKYKQNNPNYVLTPQDLETINKSNASLPDATPANQTKTIETTSLSGSFSENKFREKDSENYAKFKEFKNNKTKELFDQKMSNAPVNMRNDPNYKTSIKISAENSASVAAQTQFIKPINESGAGNLKLETTTKTVPLTKAEIDANNKNLKPKVEPKPEDKITSDDKIKNYIADEITFSANMIKFKQKNVASADIRRTASSTSNSKAAASDDGKKQSGPSITNNTSISTANGASSNDNTVGDVSNIDASIPEKLEQLGSEVGGKKLDVSSGFRKDATPGVPSPDAHQAGKAVDISYGQSGIDQGDTKKLANKALELGFTGIGVENTHLHLDTAHASPTLWGQDYHFGSAPDWAKSLTKWSNGEGGGKTTGSDASAAKEDGVQQTQSNNNSAKMQPSTSGMGGTGAAVNLASVNSEISARESTTPNISVMPSQTNNSMPNPGIGYNQPPLDKNDPGNLEPPDSVERYLKLFGLAA